MSVRPTFKKILRIKMKVLNEKHMAYYLNYIQKFTSKVPFKGQLPDVKSKYSVYFMITTIFYIASSSNAALEAS